MQILVTVFMILSLTYAAGLNGSMSLALLLLMAKQGAIQLGWPLTDVGDKIIFGVIIPLAFAEIWLSKIPSLIRLGDYFQLIWRGTVAGAITVAIAGSQGPLVMFAAGTFILAMIIQVVRMVVRPYVVSTTHGIGVPVMSMLEDLVAAVTTILAVLVPWLSLAFVVGSGYLLLRTYRGIRQRHYMREAAAMLPAINVPIQPMPPDPDPPKETQ